MNGEEDVDENEMRWKVTGFMKWTEAILDDDSYRDREGCAWAMYAAAAATALLTAATPHKRPRAFPERARRHPDIKICISPARGSRTTLFHLPISVASVQTADIISQPRHTITACKIRYSPGRKLDGSRIRFFFVAITASVLPNMVTPTRNSLTCLRHHSTFVQRFIPVCMP